LDASTPQVLINAKVVELTLGSQDRLGIDWNIRAAVSGSARPTTLPFDAVHRSRLSSLFPYGRGSQSSASNAGGVVSTTTIEDFPKGKGGGGADPIQPTFPVADKAEFTFGTLDFTQFQAAIEAIAQRQDSKVLSEPHVTVLNNQEAKILVGEVIGIPKFERNSTTGRMEITGYENRDLGVRLTVVPQVNSTDEIVVNVNPAITNLAGFDDLTSEIKVPRFTTREAQTNVRVKSGQTIAIGGLIREDIVDKKTKVPLLGDIPILDKFFSYQNKVTTKTDLLFFMTVTVIRDRIPESHTL
jgi:type II secretory pathway component GspD/PulD (secretin)